MIRQIIIRIIRFLGLEKTAIKMRKLITGRLVNQVSDLVQETTVLKNRIEILEEKVLFLYYEVSDLRSIQRHLVSQNTHILPEVSHTYESFDYQWGNLAEGIDLLTDIDFKNRVQEYIVKYSGLATTWFKDKSVLDAGCGNGRYTYGFATMGAEVVAIDQSANGIAAAKKWISEDPNLINKVTFHQKNLLDPLNLDKKFDLIWSFGVLHHTGNTYLALKNVIGYLKEGGYLFLMLYGEPEWANRGQFSELNNYWSWRRRLRHLSPAERVKLLEAEFKNNPEIVHGWFDAVSPLINDCYTESEVLTWLRIHGFENIQRTEKNRNLFFTACYKPNKKS